MRTHVFHFNTAQIHQGSCTALGDFLFKEEPHYAIKEVLAKNTRRGVLLSDSPWVSCSEHRAPPPLPAEQAATLLHISQDICHNHQEAGSDIRLYAEEGQGHLGGVLCPKDPFSSGLDWNVVLQEFDSLCNVDEDKIPSLHEGLYLKAQPRVWLWGLCPSKSGQVCLRI